MHSDATASRRTGGAEALLSHLAVGVLSLLAGVALGGWLAFETGRWEAFKSLVEGSAVGAFTFAVGLCLLALLVSALATYRRVEG